MLLRVSRSSDTVARYAGDEFLMLLPETDRNVAEQVADRIRAMIEGIGLEEGGNQYTTTIGAGVASYPRDGNTTTVLLNRVDKALYDSKRRGGNCVTVYESTSEAFAC
ncbi:MAG: Diguanylate cyclase DosC [Gammaproteobacteria bacterium]|nr:Diguanylate cyclase DosC [Gammaproteobacteria bacterium]